MGWGRNGGSRGNRGRNSHHSCLLVLVLLSGMGVDDDEDGRWVSWMRSCVRLRWEAGRVGYSPTVILL